LCLCLFRFCDRFDSAHLVKHLSLRALPIFHDGIKLSFIDATVITKKTEGIDVLVPRDPKAIQVTRTEARLVNILLANIPRTSGGARINGCSPVKLRLTSCLEHVAQTTVLSHVDVPLRDTCRIGSVSVFWDARKN
jgi:hypothetical protein